MKYLIIGILGWLLSAIAFVAIVGRVRRSIYDEGDTEAQQSPSCDCPDRNGRVEP
jgi:hypothetical protein